MFRRFLSDARGIVALIFGLGLVPLIAAIGIAIDYSRGSLLQVKIASALDAAGLAAGRLAGADNLEEVVTAFFDANFDAVDMPVNNVTTSISTDGSTGSISVTSSATLDTSFLRVVGITEIPVSATTVFSPANHPIDLVFSIDISGSMNNAAVSGGTRLKAAKSAANSLLDTLYGAAASRADILVGIVPWSSMVNVTDGTAYTGATTRGVTTFTNPINRKVQFATFTANNSQVPLLFEPPSNWKGCVYARYIDGRPDADQGDALNLPGTYGAADWTAWEPSGAASGDDGSPCPASRITPLRHDKAGVVAAIDELSASGATNIAQGMVWAWRVLMPGAPFNEAAPVPNPQPYRAIVLLTDGAQVGTSGDAYKGVFGTSTSARKKMDARLRLVADAIKAQGINIYAIQFANGSAELQDLMKDVATAPNSPYFHYAPDGDALGQIFELIGKEVANLRAVP